MLEQPYVDKDLVLVATARSTVPSVTGLAARSLTQKYGRPTFLFRRARRRSGGIRAAGHLTSICSNADRKNQDLLLKFGGHQGAVGMTVRKSDFPALREGLFKAAAGSMFPAASSQSGTAGSASSIAAGRPARTGGGISSALEPFGQGFEIPAFELRGGRGEFSRDPNAARPKSCSDAATFSCPGGICLRLTGRQERYVATPPQATPKDDFPFKWMIHEG